MNLRPELPELPPEMRHLPVHRGYPVPWFVCWLDDSHRPVQRGEGTPDFRVLHPDAIEGAWNDSRCWVCGKPIRSGYRSFLVGPMCAINRTSAEPPGHKTCAEFSAKACPFMARPHMIRREAGKPDGTVEPPGVMLDRNPGVGLVWTTRNPTPFSAGNGTLFDIGDPTQIAWYAEGREATREEVLASIDSGLPILQSMADEEGRGAPEELARRIADVKDNLLPMAA